MAATVANQLREPLMDNTRTEVRVVVSHQPRKHVHSRLLALDLLRGLIICIMAWDHTTHYFTGDADTVKDPGFETWEGPYSDYDNAPQKFLARVISHICAPGFFLTMGMSFIFFTASRRDRLGWTWRRVFRHHFIRGFILLLVEYLKDVSMAIPRLIDLAHGREVYDGFHGKSYEKGDAGKLIFHSMFGTNEVMTGLGFTMMFSQLFMPLFFLADNRRKGGAELLGIALFILSFTFSNLAIVLVQGDENISNPPSTFPHFGSEVKEPWELLGRIFFYPGELFADWEAMIYPVFPWIGITFLGMGLGFHLKRNADEAYRRMFLGSGILFCCFCLVRGFGGPMNYRGEQRGEESNASPLMRFFIQTKYPPDWAYACITLSVDFLLIFIFSADLFLEVEAEDQVATATEDDVENQQSQEQSPSIFQRVKAALSNPFYPILVFGRTSLFFYICHFWVISLLEAVFRIPDPPGGRYRFFPGVMLAWITVILIMYQLCVRYLRFKSKTDPESLWRLF